MITKAFVLGAGLGTRLRPLTDELPKPLVPIFNKPLITFALDHLIAVGVESFVINTHKLAHHFDQLFGAGEYRGRGVQLVNEPELLETGGGIKNAEQLLGDAPFITYSGDILSDIALERVVEEHLRNENDVTLALRETKFAPTVALRDGRVVDIGKRFGNDGNFDFANVAVWQPEIFRRIPPGKKISFIPIVLEWMASGGKIGGVVLNEGKWFNIGSPAQYIGVHREIAADHWQPRYLSDESWPQAVDATADIGPAAELRGCSVVGENCRIESGASLEDTIVLPGAQIASRSRLRNCIVRANRRAEGEWSDAII